MAAAQDVSAPRQDQYTGDCREILADAPARSAHCCVTSPPYFGLRNYGLTPSKWADGTESCLGNEPTAEAYIAHLVEVFRHVKRVLRDDGTVWINIADSYASGDRKTHGRRTGAKQGTNRAAAAGQDQCRPAMSPGIKAKDLFGIPWMLAFALRADGWYLRSDIIWSKSNPMPESVMDRPTTSHEHVFLLTKRERYFYDTAGNAEPCQSGPSDVRKMMEGRERIGGKHVVLSDPLSKASAATNIGQHRSVGNGRTRHRRSVWNIATAPYRGAHFATFPPALVEPCILAGTSEKGCCSDCGNPWNRITTRPSAAHDGTTATAYETGTTANRLSQLRQSARERGGEYHGTIETLGWEPTCDCGAPTIPCTVLDPFAGASTTALVAQRLGRSSISIEMNPAYAEMGQQRVGAAK